MAAGQQQDRVMTGSPADLAGLAKEALTAARQCKLSIVTAESCTAGKLAALFSEAPGAAEDFHGGFVAYTKDNKAKALGVPMALLKQKGAVCGEVAIAMAQGALARSVATLAVAITGVAGPESDEDGNPVGLVCIAVTGRDCQPSCAEQRYGDIGRDNVQYHAMADALRMVIHLTNRD
jgi:nicotinamide-nucleotide amidase